MPKEKKTLWDAYALSVSYTGLTTLIGHPAERLKVAIQTNLSQSAYSVTKQFATANLRHFSTGFFSCVLRQQSKVAYRPLLMTHIPNEIDRLQFPMMIGSILKATVASTLDTLVLSPIENIKTIQMRAIASQDKPIKPLQAMQTVYYQRGLPGFFAGSAATLGKAFPSWVYLFMTYNAIKTKREKQTFLSTILWATAASVPVTVTTTPLDVIKSQQQAFKSESNQTIGAVASQIYKNHGFGAFFKGFNCRLLHKSLSTAGAYMILDVASNISFNK
ncbi:MC/SLC25 family protein [Legionella oakridgensis]|uniref:Mitochondrial carrier protein n=2 Tax=Legionella oakridgensis TaxID=29423 RepID=W0BE46_9GAMM|nr:MC/SLC25 family protein [Legionella oakridgensis]AHE68145.1 mitochondrial carrier protein [Legionella oakridgensis ATCC 33761 = DSM 21215]ETO92359.1 carrier protein [Legionella oakridgensis RV-2-2007]KTD37274.1 carrier protein [Legionella oakridgensis]STY21114.1 Mitochondrial carrier protein [Legionella longbeachae]